jgi:tripartite-type tricarboxylate transporter receptor subunit TctC
MSTTNRRHFLTVASTAAATSALLDRAFADAWPKVLLVAPSKGIQIARDLVEHAKNGGMTFASAGVGSATHWAAERFLLSAGVKATHVPFSGGPAALTEVMTGRIDFCFIGISSAMPFIRDGRLVPLAALPAVQTKLAQQGVEPMPLTPQELDAMIAKEIVSNIKLAKAAGLKFN